MKLRESRYKPKRRRRTLIKILDTAMCIATAVLWFFHKEWGISAGDMLIITGLVVLAVTIASANRRVERGIKVSDEHIEKLRDEIGKDKFGDNSVFFD